MGWVLLAWLPNAKNNVLCALLRNMGLVYWGGGLDWEDHKQWTRGYGERQGEAGGVLVDCRRVLLSPVSSCQSPVGDVAWLGATVIVSGRKAELGSCGTGIALLRLSAARTMRAKEPRLPLARWIL